MRIAENVEMLEVQGMGVYYPVLIWDESDVVLVDTGFPGEFDLIKAGLAASGFAPEQVTKVILTHQDVDHVGSAKTFRELGATIMAYTDEVPYIQGDKPLIKLTTMEEHLDQLSEQQLGFYNMLKSLMPMLAAPVDVLLTDEQVIPVCGGIRVIATPGHTPGHIALFLEKSQIAVCGDAANIQNGELVGPAEDLTYDMDTAMKSLEVIKALQPVGYVCYHGGYLAK